MNLIELIEKLRLHKWRIRFAFTPVKKIILNGGCVIHDGYYFFRIVVEVDVGINPDNWTAYSHLNDGVKFSSI